MAFCGCHISSFWSSVGGRDLQLRFLIIFGIFRILLNRGLVLLLIRLVILIVIVDFKLLLKVIGQGIYLLVLIILLIIAVDITNFAVSLLKCLLFLLILGVVHLVIDNYKYKKGGWEK